MSLAIISVIAGLALLVWSADRFVDGAAAVARQLGMPPMLIGMVVIGFGTSAPELVVSATSALQGKPGIALGNAYGSNIANIGLILGLTALLSPIAVQSRMLRRELPVLAAVTALAAFQLTDGAISRLDAGVLLGVFALLLAWTIREGLRQRDDALGRDIEAELSDHAMPLGRALLWLVVGLVLLVLSSRLLVWGAVDIARAFGISDLVIGLTIVAVGTSLPELASAMAAVRRREHDLALGNVLGSNLFNTLGVVGLAGAIAPMGVDPGVLERDLGTVALLTLALFLICYGFRGPGRINRVEGGGLLAVYLAYNAWLISQVVLAPGTL